MCMGCIGRDRMDPDREYDLLHDRAAFHFLTTAVDQQAYIRVLARALKVGWQAVIDFANGWPLNAAACLLPVTIRRACKLFSANSLGWLQQAAA